jgi:hypothetical protein
MARCLYVWSFFKAIMIQHRHPRIKQKSIYQTNDYIIMKKKSILVDQGGS